MFQLISSTALFVGEIVPLKRTTGFSRHPSLQEEGTERGDNCGGDYSARLFDVDCSVDECHTHTHTQPNTHRLNTSDRCSFISMCGSSLLAQGLDAVMDREDGMQSWIWLS